MYRHRDWTRLDIQPFIIEEHWISSRAGCSFLMVLQGLCQNNGGVGGCMWVP